ncbi:MULTISPECIES: sensor histidine kinase [Streptomyces]|uniref:sensor histidine kinase n=1 Tax=Streptomyces TaxID=1883 RepID=UPI000C1E2F10|nr:ATP-binding protein [Streptomyces alboflavus]
MGTPQVGTVRRAAPQLGERRPAPAVPDVLDRYRDALRSAGSPLGARPELWQDAAEQAAVILADHEARADGTDQARAGDRAEVSAALGARWAAAGVGLADCLGATEYLADAALARSSARRRAAAGPDAADALHRVISRHNRATARGYEERLRADARSRDADCCGRLARDVHDHLGSSLALALRQFELYRVRTRATTAHATDGERHLRALHDALGQAADLTRGLVSGLRTVQTAADTGLGQSLRDCAAQLDPAPDGPAVRVRVTVEGDEARLPPGHRRELFLILREFLRNSFTHADPSTVAIGLRVRPAGVEVHAVDDGRGFSYGAVREHGGGLTAVRERASRLGGRCVLLSTPGDGTRLLLWVPLPGSRRPQEEERRSAYGEAAWIPSAS